VVGVAGLEPATYGL